jgi:hypothetical protein
MVNYLVMWKSDHNWDPTADDKYDMLMDILISNNWQVVGSSKKGDVADLSTMIDDLEAIITANDCALIYIDDVVQLGPACPEVTDQAGGTYEFCTIDNKFTQPSIAYEMLLMVVRGKHSGYVGEDVVQLSDPGNGRPFHYCHSMASYENFEEDHYDLGLQLLEFESIGWFEVFQAMQNACSEVNGYQGSRCLP